MVLPVNKNIKDHVCLKVKEIEEMHEILLNPKNGLTSQVKILDDRQKSVLKKLEDVDANVKQIIIHMAEVKGEREGEKRMEERLRVNESLELTKKRDFYWRTATVISVVIAVTTFYFANLKPAHQELVDIRTEVKATKDTVIETLRGGGDRYIPPAFKQ